MIHKKVLLLGRTGIIVDEATAQINDATFEIYAGTCLNDVKAVFSKTQIDHVFMGAGIGIEKRLEIVRGVFLISQTTTVSLKDAASGPMGFLPFVKKVLTVL